MKERESAEAGPAEVRQNETLGNLEFRDGWLIKGKEEEHRGGGEEALEGSREGERDMSVPRFRGRSFGLRRKNGRAVLCMHFN